MKSKKLYLLSIFLIFIMSYILHAQTKPETVYSIRVVHHPNEWYLKQIELWKAEIDKNPKNANAWFNYYKAHRYVNFNEAKFSVDKIKTFNDILKAMKKHVPESFEYAIMNYIINECNSKKEKPDFYWLEKAYTIDPDRTETYDEFMSRYEVFQPDAVKLNKFCTLWYKSKDIPSFLFEYNYNVLVTPDHNAIIVTNGDNDTFPLWILQSVKGIRKDVTVLNNSLIKGFPDYLVRKLNEKGLRVKREQLPSPKNESYYQLLCELITTANPEIKIYFAVTVSNKFIDPIKDKLYLVGIVYQYSNERIDNIALIKKNIKKYRLDYLQYDWYMEDHISAQSMDYLNGNYIFPFMKLAEHYYLSGDKQNALIYKDLSLNLAQKAKSKELINYVNEHHFE